MGKKQLELRVTLHNPNTSENTQKLLAMWYAKLAMQIMHDPNNVGKSIDEILCSKAKPA